MIYGGDHAGHLCARSLWDTASNQPLMLTVVTMLGDVATGMAYVHAHNILHGDLKPDNVLLKYEEQGLVCKVADFGLSVKMPANRTHMSNVGHGTALYMAPEVVAQKRVSKAADVYAFGVLVWELVHGRTAWDQLVRV
jgi:serine/threonine protein kinase